MTSRLLVRCCCQPTKILGSLPWDGVSTEVEIPKLEGFLPDGGGPVFSSIKLPVAEMTTLCIPVTDHIDFKQQRQIEELIYANRYRERAFKSEDTPIETLRLIPEFIEAPADLPRYDFICPYCFEDLRTCRCAEKKS